MMLRSLGFEMCYYTDAEAKELLNSLVYLVDTREKDNQHIISYLDKKGCKWQMRALNSGDYSVKIPKNEKLNIPRDIYLCDRVVVERKASLEELSKNLAQYRDRFKAELRRTNAVVYLVVEGAKWEDIIYGNYETGLERKAFYRSLIGLMVEYNMHIHFIEKKLAPVHIKNILEMSVKKLLDL